MIRGHAERRTPADAARPARTRARSVLQPVAWSALGFIAGATFWHLVGFWTLVSTAVLGSGEKRLLSARLDPPALETGSVGPAAVKPDCVLLVLDRLGGETRQAPCPTATFHHRYAGVGTKRDRQPPRTGRDDAGTGLATGPAVPHLPTR